MELSEIIGANLKSYRNNFGYSQEQLANLLVVDRSTISKYETGEREISIIHLNKLADLYGIELESFMEEDSSKHNVGLAFAFRKQGGENEDLESIACFQKVVKNYLKMEKILKEYEGTA